MEQLLIGMNKERGGIERLDGQLSERVAAAPCMKTVIEELQEVLETACRTSFRIRNISQKATSHKSVHWWTQNLTILRKKQAPSDGSFNRRKAITTYVTTGKNNIWPQKQSRLQRSGKKDIHLGKSVAL